MDKDTTRDDFVGLASVNAADVLTAGKITEGWYFYFALLLLLLFLLPTSTSTSTSHSTSILFLRLVWFKGGKGRQRPNHCRKGWKKSTCTNQCFYSVYSQTRPSWEYPWDAKVLFSIEKILQNDYVPGKVVDHSIA